MRIFASCRIWDSYGRSFDTDPRFRPVGGLTGTRPDVERMRDRQEGMWGGGPARALTGRSRPCSSITSFAVSSATAQPTHLSRGTHDTGGILLVLGDAGGEPLSTRARCDGQV